MKNLFRCLVFLFLISFYQARITQGAAESVPNRILVKFHDSLDSMQLMDFQNYGALGFVSFENPLSLQSAVLRFSTSLSPLAAAKLLRENPQVVWAQPDYLMKLFPHSTRLDEQPLFEEETFQPFDFSLFKKTKADPAVPANPELPNPPKADPELGRLWGMKKISVEGGWKVQKGSRDVIVAVLDTGIDYTHPDLINNLWRNPQKKAKGSVGYDFVHKDEFPYDDHSHGTHTAGTVGAVGGNGLGVSGVSQAVSIMGLKFIAKEGMGTTSDAILSIDFAIQHGARIMSNSWGGEAEEDEENTALEEAIERAEDANILFVAAAGNSGENIDEVPVYPAAVKKSNVLAVGNSTNKDTLSFTSNYGKKTVHVAAPGVGIVSTVPKAKYQTMTGTSMSCPHVAGLAALLLAQKPDLTASQLKQIILESVDVIPSFKDKIITGGRINVKTALEKVKAFGP